MQNKYKIGDRIKFVCRRDEVNDTLTLGKIYQVVGISPYDGEPEIINDLGHNSHYMGYRFVLVENNLIEDIKQAQNLIGKTVKSITGEYFKVECFGVANKYSDNISSLIDGHRVYVEDQYNIKILDDVVEIPKSIVINDEYIAIIEDNFVKVGCHNIPIEKVREILELWEKLQ